MHQPKCAYMWMYTWTFSFEHFPVGKSVPFPLHPNHHTETLAVGKLSYYCYCNYNYYCRIIISELCNMCAVTVIIRRRCAVYVRHRSDRDDTVVRRGSPGSSPDLYTWRTRRTSAGSPSFPVNRTPTEAQFWHRFFLSRVAIAITLSVEIRLVFPPTSRTTLYR